MNIFEHDDYREVIRARVKELNTRKRFTLKILAQKIPLQYTYLSRTLNDQKTHLTEDHLFSVSRILELYPQEAEYLTLLRARATTGNENRKRYIEDKISRLRREKKLSADVQDFSSRQLIQEMAYLFDPLCIVIHVSLHLPEFFKSPRRLCSELGLTVHRLKERLRKLSELGFIELAGDGETVVKILQGRMHYSPDHPLMRVHQNLLRQASSARFQQTAEEDKHSLMVTFSGDADVLEKVRDRYQKFLKEVEDLVGKSRDERVYQMNFDLFRWI